jgi:hypothetical protein
MQRNFFDLEVDFRYTDDGWQLDVITRHTYAATAAAIIGMLALATGAVSSRAQGTATASPEGRSVRIEARFVEPASGAEAPWGATGQILVPAAPADPLAARWGQPRAVASSPSRQTVTLGPGGRGLIRVGREIPFAGWFLRHGLRCGLLADGTEWRDVESALEVEVLSAADGTLRLALTPEFGFAHGRGRRSVSFAAERAEVQLAPGAEARFTPAADIEGFYRRLLAGYDPLRRVWPVEMLLRAEYLEP